MAYSEVEEIDGSLNYISPSHCWHFTPKLLWSLSVPRRHYAAAAMKKDGGCSRTATSTPRCFVCRGSGDKVQKKQN